MQLMIDDCIESGMRYIGTQRLTQRLRRDKYSWATLNLYCEALICVFTRYVFGLMDIPFEHVACEFLISRRPDKLEFTVKCKIHIVYSNKYMIPCIKYISYCNICKRYILILDLCASCVHIFVVSFNNKKIDLTYLASLELAFFLLKQFTISSRSVGTGLLCAKLIATITSTSNEYKSFCIVDVWF